MDAKTKGAWLVHHTFKLQQVSGVSEFDNIYAAGKAAILLSALSGSDQVSLNKKKVEVLAKAANINTIFELPKLLELLKARSLVEVSKTGVDVLGVTTTAVVQHASGVYEDLGPSPSENAALEFSEIASQAPLNQRDSITYLGDRCKLTSGQSAGLLEQAEQVGFVDFEDLGGDKVYFNGNLFRREQIAKTQAVLDSLTQEDRKHVAEVEELLKRCGCVALSEVTRILGVKLLEKLNAISMYDVNVVNNDRENVAFVTRPAAFSKYGNPLVEDALDLAKAFVSSLTYGMTRSSYARGQITMIEKLMKNTYDLVAACALVRKPPQRLLLPDTIFRFRLKGGSRLSPVFLWGLFSFPSFRKRVQTLASGSAGSMPGISKNKFMSIDCPAPPPPLQQKFAALVEGVECLRAVEREALRQAEHLFQTLLHRAFSESRLTDS